MMPCACLEDYERCIGPARDRFAGSPAVRTLLARADAPFFHTFLPSWGVDQGSYCGAAEIQRIAENAPGGLVTMRLQP